MGLGFWNRSTNSGTLESLTPVMPFAAQSFPFAWNGVWLPGAGSMDAPLRIRLLTLAVNAIGPFPTLAGAYFPGSAEPVVLDGSIPPHKPRRPFSGIVTVPVLVPARGAVPLALKAELGIGPG